MKISVNYRRNENGWFCEHDDVWDWEQAAEQAPVAGQQALVAGRCVGHSAMCGMSDTRCLAPATSADMNYQTDAWKTLPAYKNAR